jgi:hypothetical protein
MTQQNDRTKVDEAMATVRELKDAMERRASFAGRRDEIRYRELYAKMKTQLDGLSGDEWREVHAALLKLYPPQPSKSLINN